MNYSAKLWRGASADLFVEQWPGGGIVVRPDVVGAFFTSRGAHALASLQEAAVAWELAEVRCGLRELLLAAFSPDWVWTEAVWSLSGDARRRLEEDPRYGQLRRHLGRPVPGAQQAEVLRAVMGLVQRYGPLQAVRGQVGGNPLSLHATGIVSYQRTPHPISFLRRWVDRLFPEGVS